MDKEEVGNLFENYNLNSACVVDKNNKLSGILTDGDLRREMKFLSKRTSLEKFMTKKPLVVNENMPASKALAVMNEKKITSLLVTSENNLTKKNQFKRRWIC